jgi:hypothetical protein
MPQVYFRADKRRFSVGDTILPTGGDFAELHQDIGKEMEELLARLRPKKKPVRRDNLFVFEDVEAAKKYWSKMKGGNLYEVEIDAKRILHRGDMELTEEIGRLLRGKQDATQLAIQYWKGVMSKAPEVELLVPQATALQLLGSEAERLEELKRRWGVVPLTPYDVEDMFGAVLPGEHED